MTDKRKIESRKREASRIPRSETLVLGLLLRKEKLVARRTTTFALDTLGLRCLWSIGSSGYVRLTPTSKSKPKNTRESLDSSYKPRTHAWDLPREL